MRVRFVLPILVSTLAMAVPAVSHGQTDQRSLEVERARIEMIRQLNPAEASRMEAALKARQGGQSQVANVPAAVGQTGSGLQAARDAAAPRQPQAQQHVPQQPQPQPQAQRHAPQAQTQANNAQRPAAPQAQVVTQRPGGMTGDQKKHVTAIEQMFAAIPAERKVGAWVPQQIQAREKKFQRLRVPGDATEETKRMITEANAKLDEAERESLMRVRQEEAELAAMPKRLEALKRSFDENRKRQEPAAGQCQSQGRTWVYGHNGQQGRCL